MATKTIYISGQITGLPIEEAQLNFKAAYDRLTMLTGTGRVDVINPMEAVPYNKDWNWEDYMIADMQLLLKCTSVYMLKNWGKSKGARIERAVAMEMGMEIIYEN